MHITYQALIQKMEEELKKAKQAGDEEKIRGYLFAVKALAELLLETGTIAEERHPQNIKPIEESKTELKKSSSEPERLIVDEKNGDSIFDF